MGGAPKVAWVSQLYSRPATVRAIAAGNTLPPDRLTD